MRHHIVLGRRRIPITSAWLVPVLLYTVLALVVSAAAAAAIETRTVSSFPRGLWWAISLVTTVGFIGKPPETTAGAILSVALMVTGFLLLAMVSASLAALFVRQEERPVEEREANQGQLVLDTLHRLEDQVQALQSSLDRLAASAGEIRNEPPDG